MNCRHHARVKPCLQCDGTGWVCENHIDQPWDGIHGCTCGGAGAPCPKCNSASPDYPPRLPKGFKPEEER
jgi:hypothetical protein